ncbi:hypothetical protein CEXT_132971 [Caerostris extrusa]|uniref:TIL domain-containing protein n=1 Tax=Caerostris extrusa TaxID=172846 RepID=A0AAV4NPX8_CAEEX|nr:hypothetical protein CEXT_132971 [Caerostris extrusa]
MLTTFQLNTSISDCSKPNEEFLECGPPCIETCSRIESRHNCGKFCVKGCFCKKGIRQRYRWKLYQAFRLPNRACELALKCVDQVAFAKRGFVKRRDGRCIPPRLCPGLRFEGRRSGVHDGTETSIEEQSTTPKSITQEVSTFQNSSLTILSVTTPTAAVKQTDLIITINPESTTVEPQKTKTTCKSTPLAADKSTSPATDQSTLPATNKTKMGDPQLTTSVWTTALPTIP